MRKWQFADRTCLPCPTGGVRCAATPSPLAETERRIPMHCIISYHAVLSSLNNLLHCVMHSYHLALIHVCSAKFMIFRIIHSILKFAFKFSPTHSVILMLVAFHCKPTSWLLLVLFVYPCVLLKTPLNFFFSSSLFNMFKVLPLRS
jgi:hypothetical protein